MKTVQINKVKYKIFTENELSEKLGLKEKDINLILEYQKLFPELLQNGEGFCIDARQLHSQLVRCVKTEKTGDKFSQWIKRRIDKYNFEQNDDYICYSQNCETQRKDGQKGITIKQEYKLKLETAKQLCMIENNEMGRICRRYFILMEKTLRNYEEWNRIREPEKQNANKLKSALKSWAIKNFANADENGIYSREFNLINKSLVNKTALEIKTFLGYKDKQTREHLQSKINKSIDEIQVFDINLLTCGIDFKNRKRMIENLCDINYKELKEIFK